MIKICTVIGARPQFIKAAAVSRVLASFSNFDEKIIHTGQHYDANMSHQFFEELSIPTPTYHLNCGSGLHGKQTAEMLVRIEEVLIRERPDWVLVYGDTNSTLAGALAAAKLHIKVAHVEAGLRSFNRKMPEEINRITTDHMSERLYVPTKNAHHELQREGISEERILNVGDVMYDATLFYNECNSNRKTIIETRHLQSKSYVLVTIHRAENTDDDTRLKHIVNALLALSDEQHLIFPLHPRTKAAFNRLGLLERIEKRITLLEPVGYLDMLALEQHASLIVTDSGGVQKEAYFNQVPCITLRNETEGVETIHAGWNTLCSPDAAFTLKFDGVKPMHFKVEQLYGDGQACEKIANDLLVRV